MWYTVSHLATNAKMFFTRPLTHHSVSSMFRAGRSRICSIISR